MSGEKLKIVLVGCGGMSQAWLRTAVELPDVQVVGLVDLHRETAVERASQFELSKDIIYPNLTDALAAVKADIVFDVTIPDAHDAVTIEALRAGCHVLGEKPMSVDLTRARAMVAEAEKAKRLYAVIQNRRYEPNIQSVRQLITSGAVGQPQEIYSDFFLGPHFGGFRDEMAHPLLVDMAIHTFDAARYIGGADPVSVYCHAFNPGRSWYKGDASAVAIFEMTGGLVYCYRGSWCAEGEATSWNSQWRIVGQRGSITWDGEQNITASYVESDSEGFKRDTVQIDVPRVTVEHLGHDGLIREFIDCVRQGTTPQTICTDNIKSLAMVLAAVQSTETGKRVDVEW